VDASFRLTFMHTTRTAEGMTVYRARELPLVRERAPALMRAWNVLHAIVPGSPLFGETPESLARADAELTLAVVGTDDTSHQTVHADHVWMNHRIVFGARLADVLSETPDGNVVLDLTRFDELEPTPATATFPYGIGATADPRPPAHIDASSPRAEPGGRPELAPPGPRGLA
jgi:inward rectifier potassium channel